MTKGLKIANLSNLEDFPERELKPGMTEEDLVRTEFASDEDYQEYLGSLDAGDSEVDPALAYMVELIPALDAISEELAAFTKQQEIDRCLIWSEIQ